MWLFWLGGEEEGGEEEGEKGKALLADVFVVLFSLARGRRFCVSLPVFVEWSG